MLVLTCIKRLWLVTRRRGLCVCLIRGDVVGAILEGTVRPPVYSPLTSASDPTTPWLRMRHTQLRTIRKLLTLRKRLQIMV